MILFSRWQKIIGKLLFTIALPCFSNAEKFIWNNGTPAATQAILMGHLFPLSSTFTWQHKQLSLLVWLKAVGVLMFGRHVTIKARVIPTISTHPQEYFHWTMEDSHLHIKI